MSGRKPELNGEGPWLIRSHYWGAWHRRSEDGAACGYTQDIAGAGVFGFEKAREYHDWPDGRDEAVPLAEALPQLQERLTQINASRDKLKAIITDATAVSQ
jgi:hypothetical protein